MSCTKESCRLMRKCSTEEMSCTRRRYSARTRRASCNKPGCRQTGEHHEDEQHEHRLEHDHEEEEEMRPLIPGGGGDAAPLALQEKREG